LFGQSGEKPLFNVHPYSGAYGIVEELNIANRVDSLTRINNESYRKDTRTMQTPLLVLDAHIQAVNTNRLQQARRAELIRLARQQRPSQITRFIASMRRTSGRSLVSLGQWLQREPVTAATRDREALDVTSTKAMPS
jgi:hypothetical protein